MGIGAHGPLGACMAAPAPPRPQALLAEDEAPGSILVNRQHAHHQQAL